MRGLINVVTVLVVAVCSVSAFASDESPALQQTLRLASANQSSGTIIAKSADHGSQSAETDHSESASGHGQGHPNLGPVLPLWSCIPFACMLLSIALWPLLLPDFWHHHFGKISAFWAAALAIPFFDRLQRRCAYMKFFILFWPTMSPLSYLLWSLYTVSGGILLRGTLRGTPVVNVVILIIGTLLASWMGTTGAAMLLIRPFLRANNYRKNRTFMVVFFHIPGCQCRRVVDPPGGSAALFGISYTAYHFFGRLKSCPTC